MAECIPKCSINDYNCLNNENCIYGYWKESNEYPCVSCDIISNCNKCGDYAGCIECNEGYKKEWYNNCGIGINVCKKIINYESPESPNYTNYGSLLE